MELHIVNADPKYSKPKLKEPSAGGYIYLAARVRPNKLPVVLPSGERKQVLVRLKELAGELEGVDGVVKALVFRAIVRPPTDRFSRYLQERERDSAFHVADFDVLVLIQTRSPEAIPAVQQSAPYRALSDALSRHAEATYTLIARNARRIDDVDTTRKGLFLFNHFAADDPSIMLELWDYLAGWYTAETHLDNSVALVPVADGNKSDYAIVNWARWDASPIRHFWNQLSKKSFWNYVTANLEANHAASMPVYCRLA